ncbi:MAG: MetQ/NlpA family ABC transporter substrate-binding protein [Bacteroidales bacterium]|nr:MetQ/NlpA family ABC transporter substrate-binding protein [Anaerotignum sp.]MCI5679004.1 MetQ/NlpA family ABC transporter substrate-binding protein [Bacteroidales bacterium]MDY3927555.1 MetQ/NlpA family ABC transporter substrate-binding protein [Anaerotignum sp.]
MKKFFAILLTGVLTLGLAACGGSAEAPADDASAEAITLKIGASPTPHAEILEAAKEELAAKGINLEIVEFTDYVQPNLATESGDLDANYFQHQPYLDSFNAEQGTDLVSIGAVHYEPMGIYAGTVTDLANIPEGTKVGIPNDATNGGRALLLLEANGLITLDPEAGTSATKLDIVDNPLNLEIIEMEAAQLPLSLGDLGIAVINGNYAMQNGLKTEDALAIEAADSLAATTYGNIVAVKAGNENAPGLAELMEVLQGPTIAEFINSTYGGAVAPMN